MSTLRPYLPFIQRLVAYRTYQHKGLSPEQAFSLNLTEDDKDWLRRSGIDYHYSEPIIHWEF